MKNITLNRNSYHYLLATRGGFTEWAVENNPGFDFCEYTRKVIKGAFLSLLTLGLITVAAFLSVEILMGIGFSIYYGMFIFSEPAVIVLSISIALAVLIGVFAVSENVKTVFRKKKLQSEKTDSFLSHAYDGLKDRFCKRVSFVGEKK